MLNTMMNMIRPGFRQAVANDEGVTAVEYSIMAALIAGVLVTGVTLFTDGITRAFTTIAGHLN